MHTVHHACPAGCLSFFIVPKIAPPFTHLYNFMCIVEIAVQKVSSVKNLYEA